MRGDGQGRRGSEDVEIGAVVSKPGKWTLQIME